MSLDCIWIFQYKKQHLICDFVSVFFPLPHFHCIPILATTQTHANRTKILFQCALLCFQHFSIVHKCKQQVLLLHVCGYFIFFLNRHRQMQTLKQKHRNRNGNEQTKTAAFASFRFVSIRLRWLFGSVSRLLFLPLAFDTLFNQFCHISQIVLSKYTAFCPL